jgi:CDP-4-dehydro-6-deoxyglucose reductase/3-phenylpropionate/trans-cinnamate dioxygenase ferredoxin reductase subunit
VLLTLPIRDVQPATPRARLVRIALAGRDFPYEPGQAILVASHGHEPRDTAYSIAAPPEEAARNAWLELLVGVDETGTPGPHLSLERESLVDVEGPIGRFTFPSEPADAPCVFVAGGTGIAPLRAMIRTALASPNRRIGLLYSARTPGDFAFDQEWRALASTGRLEYRQTVTRHAATDWSGNRGRIGIGELAPLVHDAETMCFVCGPPTMVEDVPKLLKNLGVPRDRVYIEEWTSVAESPMESSDG